MFRGVLRSFKQPELEAYKASASALFESVSIIAAEHGAQHECNRILPFTGGCKLGISLFLKDDMLTVS